MVKYAEKVASKRAPLLARPQQGVDRATLRTEISQRFSKTLAYLAK
ncbi:MAG TPA: hypothetical protein VF589_02095 [Allosphingosinicella sp.]